MSVREWQRQRTRVRWQRRLARSPWYQLGLYALLVVAVVALLVLTLVTTQHQAQSYR